MKRDDPFTRVTLFLEKKKFIKPSDGVTVTAQETRSSDFWIGIGTALFLTGLGSLFASSVYLNMGLVILGIVVAVYSRIR